MIDRFKEFSVGDFCLLNKEFVSAKIFELDFCIVMEKISTEHYKLFDITQNIIIYSCHFYHLDKL